MHSFDPNLMKEGEKPNLFFYQCKFDHVNPSKYPHRIDPNALEIKYPYDNLVSFSLF